MKVSRLYKKIQVKVRSAWTHCIHVVHVVEHMENCDWYMVYSALCETTHRGSIVQMCCPNCGTCTEGAHTNLPTRERAEYSYGLIVKLVSKPG